MDYGGNHADSAQNKVAGAHMSHSCNHYNHEFGMEIEPETKRGLSDVKLRSTHELPAAFEQRGAGAGR